jgi:hypothetical protein
MVMAVATALLVDRFGLVGTGMGYFAAYLFYLPMMLLFAAPRIGLIWNAPVLRALGIITAGLAVLLWPVLAPSPVSVALGAVAAGGAAIYLGLRAARALDVARLVRPLRRAKS